MVDIGVNDNLDNLSKADFVFFILQVVSPESMVLIVPRSVTIVKIIPTVDKKMVNAMTRAVLTLDTKNRIVRVS